MGTLGKRIRELRGQMSQGEFADYVGIHLSTLKNWEKDKRSPDYNALLNLIEKFNLSTDWLLLGQGGRQKCNSSNTEEDCITAPLSAPAEHNISIEVYKKLRDENKNLTTLLKITKEQRDKLSEELHKRIKELLDLYRTLANAQRVTGKDAGSASVDAVSELLKSYPSTLRDEANKCATDEYNTAKEQLKAKKLSRVDYLRSMAGVLDALLQKYPLAEFKIDRDVSDYWSRGWPDIYQSLDDSGQE